MGRQKLADKKQLLIRVLPDLWLETILLNPSLQDETGYLKYGAISQYFSALMRKDNDTIKDRLRREAQGGLNGSTEASITRN